MTVHVKLEGSLRYADPAAAAAAHAAMKVEGTRVEGDTIVLALESTADVGAMEAGVDKALETALAGAVEYTDERGERRELKAVGRSFWARRWTDGQTGFHEGKPNDLLAAHIERVEAATKPRARILVPLSGKAFDLRWLAERGHEVVGVEFVGEAVRAFFDEWGAGEPEELELGGQRALRANGVTIVVGDFFAVSPEAVGKFDVVYDRAALVALEPSTRERYVAACRSLLEDGGVTFLVAFGYDQSRAPGPPFSVDTAMVRELYAGRKIEMVATRSVPTSPRLAEAGVAAFEESAYLIA